MDRNKVLVLLSTYHGEAYLEEQIVSLLLQQDVDIHIIIRDDGSSDSTLGIIRSFTQQYPSKINYWADTNVGAKRSFFSLMEHAYREIDQYDFFSFCDQDDVWESNKLSTAVTALQSEDNTKPLLYCSSTQMVDAKLNKLSIWPIKPTKSLSAYNALVENVVVGCTSVINPAALELLNRHLPRNYEHIIMHDWWIYLCVSTFGKVIFDPDPQILYRQHGNNALGGQIDSWFTKWRKRFHRFFNGKNHYIISNQAKEFEECFGQLLDRDTLHQLQLFLRALDQNLWGRLKYAATTSLYRHSTMDQLILRAIISAGKL